MPDPALDEIRRAEYRKRRDVELLRQQLYAQADPSQSPTLSQALRAAERDLRRVEAERREREAAAGAGVLVDSTGKLKPGGVMMGAETTHIDAKVSLRMSHVPTGIAHLLDPARTPLVSFELKYLGDPFVRLRIASYVEGYSARAVDTVELMPGQSSTIDQLPTFFPDRLQSVTELTRATLHVEIDDLDHQAEQHRSFPIWLLARTSAYNGVEDPSTGQWVDLSTYFGAWVTPNAPSVLRLLRRAADLAPARQIAGYQTDAAGVEAQVKAIFSALKAEEIVYVNSVLSFGAAKGHAMQRVRLPSESLRDKAANCIDGAVLMASVLEAASLNPALVFVPGHAFLGWEMQDGTGMWDYLETTMIGTHDFDAAHASGQAQAKENKAQADEAHDPSFFQLLSVPELRARYGVTPME